MLVLDGFYIGNDMIKLETPQELLKENTRVKVTVPDTEAISEDEQKQREEGFREFSKFFGTLRADFDYRKAINEWRDERYGHTVRC